MQIRRVKFGCRCRQLVGGGVRGLKIVCGNHDLDVGPEELRSRRLSRWTLHVAGLIHHSANCGLRRVNSAFREPQEGQARLWLVSPMASVPVRLLSLLKLAPEPMELAQLIERHADDRPLVGKKLTGPFRLRESARP